MQLLDRGDRDVGKDQLFFPIKEVAPRTLRPHTVFLCEGFSMCLSKRSELRHIDPKAKIERWDILDSLSKRSRAQLNSLEQKGFRREVSNMKKVLSADVANTLTFPNFSASVAAFLAHCPVII